MALPFPCRQWPGVEEDFNFPAAASPRLPSPGKARSNGRVTITFSAKPDAKSTSVRFFTTGQRNSLPAGITRAELSLKPNSRIFHHAENTLCIGLGDAADIKADTIRRAAGTAGKALRQAGRHRISLHLGEHAAHIGAAVEGLLLGDFLFEDFKDEKTAGLARVTVVVPGAQLATARRAGARAKTVAEMANLARRIANQPGNIVHPAALAELAQWHARHSGLRCTVLDEKKLRAGKFGGILAVGTGSDRPPRLIIIEHRGGKKGEAPIALVGKAVTFDTGGISIKPAADMEKMIWDKCGGTAVLGAILAIAKLGIRRNVVALIPAAENMPGSRAYRPGDIVTCHDGKKVEVVNTDAEGRMILADAIAYARKTLKARTIIDVATLTGACGVALGEFTAGLWSSRSGVATKVLEAAEAAGEQVWLMPHYPEYDTQIRSDFALVKNSGGRLGGACTAAAFLRTFAGDTPWAHLDIAYPARMDRDLPWVTRGATGFAVRTLVNFVEAAKAGGTWG